jgi:eukaryotic-like serine/threonine-protein kinase
MKVLFLKGKTDDYFYNSENKLHKVVSAGKFSTVYKGQRSSDNAFVIIKKLCSELSSDRKIVKRFQQESSFNYVHTNIIRIFDYIYNEDNHYIISEFINGINLKQISVSKKHRKSITEKFYIRCIIEVLDAIEELHKNDVFHRDIKPSNIMVEFSDPDGNIDYSAPKIKLIDLGQFKIKSRKVIDIEPFSLIYSAPEQVLNISSLINATSDIYSAGITLYELLSGHPPFLEKNPLKLITLQVAANIPPDRKISSELFEILKKATAKYIFPKPPHYYKLSDLLSFLKEGQNKRYQDAMQFRQTLFETL